MVVVGVIALQQTNFFFLFFFLYPPLLLRMLLRKLLESERKPELMCERGALGASNDVCSATKCLHCGYGYQCVTHSRFFYAVDFSISVSVLLTTENEQTSESQACGRHITKQVKSSWQPVSPFELLDTALNHVWHCVTGNAINYMSLETLHC